MAGYRVAAIGGLGDGLGVTRHLEAVFGYGDVGRVRTTRDLAAVGAVAERLVT
jgi:hypothetical protein